jgi:hypothetical protein
MHGMLHEPLPSPSHSALYQEVLPRHVTTLGHTKGIHGSNMLKNRDLAEYASRKTYVVPVCQLDRRPGSAQPG